ncbi:hypothetical protein L226DRAFT_532590 [Lentinus tigrinus ALCF2SS1-7]|uniref:Transcription factor CBF/NF-Y/archaeal histone domain-containing protein n=1 Tax=Lentinus tigrinus ALCF2SS1-6 TaxID=1328759 RepID=A0A5C2SF74_9APHY|nr:hypothetical protein L227DRAFT_609621 [Lentinus tigrinus ALCF2SS1-6]RPD77821.1 hypothetical protein L226DRAFT_532590 [Lentinus tigrinus ALCF2SS1-7]
MALSSGFTAISADGRHSLGATTSGFNSENDEEEIDQLDSALDEESDGMEPEVEEEESASTAAKGRRKLGARTPGHTLIPQDRLDNMLQAEGAGPHMSKEAVYMLSIATEEFVKKLAEAGYQQTISENRQHVQYRDLANVAHKRSEFKFLDDTIPKPISIAEAMQRRAAKERELLEDDPAISATAPSSPPFYPIQPGSISIGPSASASSKAKAKTRQSLAAQTNGQQENGSASVAATPTPSAAIANTSASAARGSRQRDRRGRWSNAPSANGSHEGTPSSTAGTEGQTRAGSARIRNRSARAREAAEAQTRGRSSHTNGTPSLQNGRSASAAHESPSQQEQRAPNQVVGPASGFLEDGNRLVNGNPGRTIYSQQRPPAQPR